MPTTILGLDIGGANLKAATPDKRAVSVPFPLWKQPDKLPAALAELAARFPDVEELAVTMTGELCDCFETKREGVSVIIAAVRFASGGRRIRVWSTDGVFVDSEEAKRHHMKVAAANWHALATLAGQYVPEGWSVLIDIGSTTTDIIPILDGKPVPKGTTDQDRLQTGELVYTGFRRTPLCAIPNWRYHAAELFATTLDVYLILGLIPENASDCDTADGRPATIPYARARLARMLGGDVETIPQEKLEAAAVDISQCQFFSITRELERVNEDLASMPSSLPWDRTDPRIQIMLSFPAEQRVGFIKSLIRPILSGSGEPLLRRFGQSGISLADKLGHEVSACAPAYAVAVLAAESQA